MNLYIFLGTLVITTTILNLSQARKICAKVDRRMFPGCVDQGFKYTIRDLTHEYYAKKHSNIINSINKKLGNCSKYANIILCSLYVPQCRETRAVPWLPCRVVCDDFVKACGDIMASTGLNWLKSLCSELPKKGDCFVPSHYKPSSNSTGLVCNQMVEKDCFGGSYKTFVSRQAQEEMKPNRSKTLHALLQHEKNKTCQEIIRQLVCAKFMPLCQAGAQPYKAMTLCRDKCYDLYQYCSPEMKNNSVVNAYCAVTAQGDTETGVCVLNGWPSASYWPHAGNEASLPYSFPTNLIAVLVLVPVLAVVAIYVAVALRKYLEGRKDGYVKQPKSYTEPEGDPVI